MIDLIDWALVGRITRGYQIADNNYDARELGVVAFGADLLSHVFGIEDDRDHRQAVKMETEFVAETNGRDTHIERKPEVDKPYILIEFLFTDENISQNINESCRDAEPYKEPRFARDKKHKAVRH